MLPRGCLYRNCCRGRSVYRAFTTTTCTTSSEGPTPGSHPDTHPLSMRSGEDLRTVEKLVGYPSPLLSLRHLVGSEINHLSEQIRRLLSSSHPVVKHSRWLQDSPQHVQSHGLITLLTSKAANILNPILPDVDQFGILPGQRVLAEATEMINSALLLHMEVVSEGEEEEEVKEKEIQTQLKDDLVFGNKLIILGGDLLLARACRELAHLYVPKVVGLISDAISDIMAASYWRLSLTSPPPLPSPGFSFSLPFSKSSDTRHIPSDTPTLLSVVQSCRYKMYQHHASLLRNSCVSAAVLAELGLAEQSRIAELGHHLGIVHEVLKDRARVWYRFQQGTPNSDSVVPTAELVRWQDEVCHHHCQQTLDALAHLPDCDAVALLDNHVHSLIDSTGSV